MSAREGFRSSQKGPTTGILSEAAAKSKDPVALPNVYFAGFLDFARNDRLRLCFQFPFQNFSDKLRIGFAFG